MIPDEFTTVDGEAADELREQASRFLAIAFHAATREAAESRLAEIRKEYHDATHHCFAYRVDTAERFSDDGEPSGPAGKPIMQAIERHGLYNVCVVVVRWFGGTKLGTGGLVRAYSAAADAVLKQAKTRRCFFVTPVTVRFPHPVTNAVMHTIARFGAKVRSNEYDNDVTLTVLLKPDQIEPFSTTIVEATRGEATIQKNEEKLIISL